MIITALCDFEIQTVHLIGETSRPVIVNKKKKKITFRNYSKTTGLLKIRE